MKLPRRKVLALAAGAAVSPAYIHAAGAETPRPLAERLADYAEALRYKNLDAAAVEQTKIHQRKSPAGVSIPGHVILTSRAGSCRTYTG